MIEYDIKANVTNLRKSGNYFSDGYKPSFDIHKEYSTTGIIHLISKQILNAGESSEALIKFITPTIYPRSLWVGKKLYFREGNEIMGIAVVEEVLNKVLLSVDSTERPLNI